MRRLLRPMPKTPFRAGDVWPSAPDGVRLGSDAGTRASQGTGLALGALRSARRGFPVVRGFCAARDSGSHRRQRPRHRELGARPGLDQHVLAARLAGIHWQSGLLEREQRLRQRGDAGRPCVAGHRARRERRFPEARLFATARARGVATAGAATATAPGVAATDSAGSSATAARAGGANRGRNSAPRAASGRRASPRSGRSAS